jgi:SAM-dependent methyltransferase
MADISNPQGTNPDQLLEQAIELFHLKRNEEGLSLLENAYQQYPENRDIAGNLAWIYLSFARYDKAVDLYEKLSVIWQDNPEVKFRLLQARLLKNGYSVSILKEMIKVCEKPPLRINLFRDLIVLDREYGDSRYHDLIIKKAAGYFPEDSGFSVECLEISRVKRHRFIKKILRLSRLDRILGLLFKSSIVRKLFRESTDSSVDYIYSAIQDYYRAGSVNTRFIKSSIDLIPENFEKHFSECKCPWFRWMREKQAGYEHKDKTLLDIGCGSGYVGHHFQILGYKVTALSGNPVELAECRKRGMKTVQTEMHQTGLPSASFDAVLASHVLEHSVAPLIMLWEIRRLLKEDGYLHVHLPYPIDGDVASDFPEVYDPEKDAYNFEFDENNRIKNPFVTQYTYGTPLHLFVLTYWQWRWLFKNAGFDHVASTVELPNGMLIEPDDRQIPGSRESTPVQMLFLLKKSQKTLDFVEKSSP